MLDTIRGRAARTAQRISFAGSAARWERRDKESGTSGAGSYGAITCDLVISLNVILHPVEDDAVVASLRDVDRAALRHAMFTEDQQQSPGDAHVRYRNVADWMQMMPGWQLMEKIDGPHRHPSAADPFILERA